MATENYLSLPVEDFLERLATGGRAPGGGSAAALTVAFAASLVSMVARCSRESWQDAPGVSAQALAIQKRVAPLAYLGAEVWEEANEALRQASGAEGEGSGGDVQLERKLDLAAAVPLEIAELGADTAELAALVGELCDGAFRADAAAAAALAAGGASAAAHLVEVNLAVRKDDPRLVRARTSEQAAADAARRTLATIR